MSKKNKPNQMPAAPTDEHKYGNPDRQALENAANPGEKKSEPNKKA